MAKIKLDAAEFQRACSDFVEREVICCLSGIVHTLAINCGTCVGINGLHALTDEAFELSTPIDDYEEAAIQAGWTGPYTDGGQHFYRDSTDGQTWACASWEELCREFDIEPYQREVYEHWAVSNYLAEKLIAHGEKVGDFDSFKVWARCTTGQAISIDGVIETVYREMMEAK